MTEPDEHAVLSKAQLARLRAAGSVPQLPAPPRSPSTPSGCTAAIKAHATEFRASRHRLLTVAEGE